MIPCRCNVSIVSILDRAPSKGFGVLTQFRARFSRGPCSSNCTGTAGRRWRGHRRRRLPDVAVGDHLGSLSSSSTRWTGAQGASMVASNALASRNCASELLSSPPRRPTVGAPRHDAVKGSSSGRRDPGRDEIGPVAVALQEHQLDEASIGGAVGGRQGSASGCGRPARSGWSCSAVNETTGSHRRGSSDTSTTEPSPVRSRFSRARRRRRRAMAPLSLIAPRWLMGYSVPAASGRPPDRRGQKRPSVVAGLVGIRSFDRRSRGRGQHQAGVAFPEVVGGQPSAAAPRAAYW